MKILTFVCWVFLIICCKEEKSEDLISFEPSEISTLNYSATTFKLKVAINADWTVVPSQSWCKVAPENGAKGTTELTVTIAANNSLTSRTAVLTFKSGTTKKGFSITQREYIEQVLFSDQSFQNYCLSNFDGDKDGIVSKQEAALVTNIDISGKGIVSLAGLECFTALQMLNCSNNNITEINLTSLPKINSLICSGNKLTKLDIQTNVSLSTLNCTENPISQILVWTGFVPGNSFLKPVSASYIEPEITTPPGYILKWQDEFNDPLAAGKAVLPNTSNWWYETGGGGWGNNELETYIAAVSETDTCASIYNGTLKIKAKKVGSQILSVRMNTSQSWTYGYFEARLKLPTGKGTWPAFWMMPKTFHAWPDDGEIDIMEEVGYHPNYVSSSIHCKAYYHSIGTQKTAEKFVATAQSEFHVYAVEWTADFIKGYIDGVSYFQFDNDHANNYNTWPFYNPFYLKLNLAWGGNWGGAQGVDESILPATYEVDYVRVFQK